MILANLVASDFGDKLHEEKIKALDRDWAEKMKILAQSGILSSLDVFTGLDPRECDVVERAAELIREEKITEVQHLGKMLCGLREALDKLAS